MEKTSLNTQRRQPLSNNNKSAKIIINNLNQNKSQYLSTIMKKSINIPIVVVVKIVSIYALLTLVQQQSLFAGVKCSGIFEIELSSLVDSYGRDLRDDCCSWQNQTTASALNNNNQYVECDPSKCQLIIRICVKNYQTQIDPNQCTFGELSAQVMKPNEPAFYHPPQSQSIFRSQQELPLTSQTESIQNPFMTQKRQQPQITPTNIHHQRMLFQQQHLAPYITPANLQQQQQPHTRYQPLTSFGSSSSINNHQTPLSSAQPRSMRTIAFNQPIIFPFNFTWPVSS